MLYIRTSTKYTFTYIIKFKTSFARKRFQFKLVQPKKKKRNKKNH